ncbi:MAG: FAD-dependent oxidoreductase, partial [Thermoguttaceae bacterium]|nr:FAD-dependent oxidoreductase [Thermoguttaceae bacterium]
MASKRVLIVGGVAGGAACAARLRRLDEEAEIFLYERGADVSFANCGLPYYVGGVIKARQKLLLVTPEQFRDMFRIEVRTRQSVERIDRKQQTVEIRNVQSGALSTERYDALVLSPGAEPVRLPLPGSDLPGIFTLRNLEDVDRINGWIEQKKATRVVIVGAGYIGLEMLENFHRRGLSISVLERLDQIMAVMDPEMVRPVEEEIRRRDVDLRLGSQVAGFQAGPDGLVMVQVTGSEPIPAHLVIMAVGVRPDVKLAREAGLEIGPTGGIRVNEQMQTSDPAIWAVGDAVEVRDWVTGQPTIVPLAGPAGR